jgi:hypothetical protein
MAGEVGSGEKTRCCTGNGVLMVTKAEKQGFSAIFEPELDSRFLRKLRTAIYGDKALAGHRRKWLTGRRLRGGPEVLGQAEGPVALRLISAARRVD